ncbi:MAG: hypothetical protein NTV56_12095 [Alphaproteobacteria bacterium]|nr:hypothetical protein [Alphaproteobacteria bacterium]
MDRERLGTNAEPADRHEVVDRIIGKLAVEVRIEHERRIRAHQQRVAVGRSLGHAVDPDVTGTADLVLHYELLTERFSQPLGQRAGQDVGDPAGRERHDDMDGLAEIRLRGGGRNQRRHECGQEHRADCAYYPHIRPPRSLALWPHHIPGGNRRAAANLL